MKDFEVNPDIVLVGNTWFLRFEFEEVSSIFDKVATTIETTEPAGITVVSPLSPLQVTVVLRVPDTVGPTDIVEALMVDDVVSGQRVGTVWSRWKEGVEANVLDGRDNSPKNVTARVRSDARRALVNQRGWTVLSVHQHEADGSALDE